MAAEGEVGKHGTSEFGRWRTEFEHKLNDWELGEADHDARHSATSASAAT